MLPVYKSSRENTQPENVCDIVFENAEGPVWSSNRVIMHKHPYEKGVTRSFAKFARQHLWQSLFFDKIRCCRSATSLKTRLQHRCFPVNFVKFVKTPFLQIATERMLLNIAVSIVVKGDWQTKL